MVLDAIFNGMVGPYHFAGFSGDLLVLLAMPFQNKLAESMKRDFFILVLTAMLSALTNQPGRNMHNAHSRLGFILMLSTRTP